MSNQLLDEEEDYLRVNFDLFLPRRPLRPWWQAKAAAWLWRELPSRTPRHLNFWPQEGVRWSCYKVHKGRRLSTNYCSPAANKYPYRCRTRHFIFILKHWNLYWQPLILIHSDWSENNLYTTSEVSELAPNGTNMGLFKISFLYILAENGS